MLYFDKFPTVLYDPDGSGNVKLMTNILKRVRVRANMAKEFVNDGGNVKSFMEVLKQSELAELENSGEIFGFWGKKMLPQIFKWDDKSKMLISGAMDELELLSKRKDFLKSELKLDDVIVISSEDSKDQSGRINSAMPLSPAIIYA